MFLIEGKKLVQEAIDSNWNIETIIIREDKPELNNELNSAFDIVPRRCMADPDVFNSLSRMQQSEGILAVVHFPSPDFCQQKELEKLPEGQGFLLDAMQDPGNLGTLMRSMDWMGIPHLLLGPGCVDPLNLKSLRSSMGAIFRINIYQVPDLKEIMRKEADRIMLADMQGTPLHEQTFSSNAFVLIGNEANGIGTEVKEMALHTVSIPRFGGGESLNAGVAGSLIAWEMTQNKRS